jgi:four helix bundle protein
MEMRERPKRAGDDLAERLIEFAARIGKVVDAIPDTRLGRHVAGQLVRCGTAGAPNYAEARGAESKKDFIHKVGICLKELRESQCWLELTVRAELLPETRLSPLLEENDQLIAIFVKSVATAKTRKAGPRTADAEPCSNSSL